MKSISRMLISFLGVFSVISAVQAGVNSVQTSAGEIVGKVENGVGNYLGIPYAQAPIGDLRWHAPVPHPKWLSPLNAFSVGPACLQAKNLGKPEATGSEDCLNLNVWAPLNSQGGPKSVLVFIHGGFYVEGESDRKDLGAFRIQDGFQLAEQKNIIVVSIEYRLGALGFLASPVLDDGSIESRSGNFGLMDQIAALKWVHENIASFGGDPSRVTLFGQSAGASSILTLMASSLTEGLFSQAIVDSGYLGTISRDEALSLGNKLVSQTGCSKSSVQESLACLRALTSSQIIASIPSSAVEGAHGLYIPNDDGYLVQEPLKQAYDQGHVRKIPVIFGSNSDETTILAGALYGKKISTEEEFEALIEKDYGASRLQKSKSVYENSSFTGPQNQLVQFSTDSIFTCPLSSLLRNLSSQSDAQANPQTWKYAFTHHVPFPGLKALGAFHGIEIAYIFGNLPGFINLMSSEKSLSQSLMNYWSNFVKYGAPDYPGQPKWSQYSATQENTLLFDNSKEQIKQVIGFRNDRCSTLGL